MCRACRMRIVGVVVGVAAACICPAAFGKEDVPAASLRDAVARHIEALPSAAPAVEESDCRPGSATTCCKDGCRDAEPPREEGCGRSLGKGVSIGLGVLAGTGLGWGLGRDAGGSPLASEFRPFGLTDSLITAGSVAIAFKGYKWLDREPPMLCQGGFSGCSGTEDSLRGLDAQVRKHWVRPSFRGRALASSLSYATVFSTLVLPSAFLLGSDQPAQGREFWLSVESGAITAALLQLVKHRVNRPRPYAHYCEPGCGDDLSERDTQLSFFSGHTALAFSFAVSAGTIASMRDYRNAGWVLGSGLTMAAATGYLRIAADRHYFTDVLVGAVVGAAVGWAVPRLHGTRDRPVDDSSVSGRRATSRPSLALPVPLRGPEGGLWLQGAIGAEAKGVTLSWSF